MKTALLRLSALCFPLLFAFGPLRAQEYRTLDGSNNNFLYPAWGAADARMVTATTVGYEDGVSAPAGPGRPNPRFISNALFAQTSLKDDPRGLSAYTWAWGQFIDHDITLVPDDPSESMDIAIPPFDAFFDPQGTGGVTIPMHRSAYDRETGTGVDNPRVHLNKITAFIDASAVYGSDEQRAAWLRTFAGGRLKVSTGNLPPFNTTTGELGAPIDPDAPAMAMPFPFVQHWFVVGDERGNENPFLLAMHTLFLREHNRLCAGLADEHPGWTDEQLYQHARKLVGALMQAIVYEEWLPTLGMELAPYNGYNPYADPGIMNVFSAAAFRYGHTTINSVLLRMDDSGHPMPQGNILLQDAFFNPEATLEVGGIEPYLIGMSTVVEQDFDCQVIDGLRNFLFGPPGAGGLDLVALNINRGRDRGLPDYNTVRADFGLAPKGSFGEICSDPLMSASLRMVYQDANNIDPWVGMLAEDHMPDALFGETAMRIIEQQFLALRNGDRFYYENDPWLSLEEKAWIRNNRLADIIRRNCPITCLHDEVFIARPLAVTGAVAARQSLPFSIFPNPSQGRVNLRMERELSEGALVRITDNYGREVLRRKIGPNPGNGPVAIELDGSLPAGLYHAFVVAEDAVGRQSFVRVLP
ncbi:MAG: peroxidase family protein [Phaeodactylibacter sp.]|nr:peroxidase family protein [Phaeodactylibacter sp.]